MTTRGSLVPSACVRHPALGRHIIPAIVVVVVILSRLGLYPCLELTLMLKR